MRLVTVVYHYEDGQWWADSPLAGLETFVAGGRDLQETRQLAREGAEFHLGTPIRLKELFDPRQVMKSFVVEHSARVTVSGGPAPSSAAARTRVTITPAQPCAIAS